MNDHYFRNILLGLINDREYLIDNKCPDNSIEVSVKFEKKVYFTHDDENLELALHILSHSLEKVFKKFEDENNFFEPQLIVRPEGVISAKILMKQKDPDEIDSESKKP
jgi:hypothetical protein